LREFLRGRRYSVTETPAPSGPRHPIAPRDAWPAAVRGSRRRARRYVDHQQHAAALYLVRKALESRVRYRDPDQTRHPDAEEDAEPDQQQHAGVVDAPITQRDERQPHGNEPAHDAADDTSQQRAVADVGLLQHRRLVQLGEIDAAPRQEMHVPVLDPREQKIVRASSALSTSGNIRRALRRIWLSWHAPSDAMIDGRRTSSSRTAAWPRGRDGETE
jgi:hypothetical protein